MYKIKQYSRPLHAKVCEMVQIMKKSLEKRISISSCWASSRVALLDTVERYEDSYAITQEFREWLVSFGSSKKNSGESNIELHELLKKFTKKQAK